MSAALLPGEIIVDAFAGGGGASEGIEPALGCKVDIAINHNPAALAMHAANHPGTVHLPHNVWKVDPLAATQGRPVGLLWASPDCKHFSKAKGGKPVKRSIRDLAWVVVRWAKQVRPRVIMLENVEEFRDWGPVAEDGRPCAERRGQTFREFVQQLRRLGYRVEHRELRACDYGAPTIRRRLFMIARRDGLPIVWPKPTHRAPADPDVVAGRKAPWRTAAEIIDWSLPCHSIFLSREEGRALGVKRPLAEATMARIARGLKRYVIDAEKPFVVTYAQQGGGNRDPDTPLHTVCASAKDYNGVVVPSIVSVARGDSGGRREYPIADPLGTVSAGGVQHGVVAPYLVPRYGERAGQEPRTHSVGEPVPTVVPTGNGGSLVAAHLTKFRTGSTGSDLDAPCPAVTANSFIKRPGGAPPLGVVSAFLAQHNTGVVARDVRDPVSTVTQTGSHQAVVSAGLMNMRGSDRRMSGPDDPARTVTAGGYHQAELRAFLIKYYGQGSGQGLEEPAHTVTVRERFGLVTIAGEPYEIVDIGMRMLSPRELYRAQGFPDEYIIDRGMMPDGATIRLTKTQQIAMCGNSVCPPLARALVAANFASAPAVRAPRAEASAPLFERVAS